MSKYYDEEWEQAWNTDEEPQYYWILDRKENKRYIRYYKPSIAKVVEKRLRGLTDGIIDIQPVRP